MTPNENNPSSWGWTPFFENQLEKNIPLNSRARVIKEERNHYLLINGLGEVVGGEISGNWKKRKVDTQNPCIGDWVILGEVVRSKENFKFYNIERRLDRFSEICRMAAGKGEKSQILAANVEVCFMVSSCNQDFDLERIERYLSLLVNQPIQPILVLTKCDLPDAEIFQNSLKERFPKIPTAFTRRDQIDSFNSLQSHLKKGTTSVFLGSSGVGKSTLTNHLLGEAVQKLQDVRDNDSKGRHTTTGRSLFQIQSKQGLIIDTPGLREVKIPLNTNKLEEGFEEITDLAATCRFSNCGHKSEPGCAVKAAVQNGLISPLKLNNYLKIRAELDSKPFWKK